MLILLRIVFGVTLFLVMRAAYRNGQNNLQAGDLLNAGYVALSVILAVANALVWAPYFGGKIADPLTGVITTGAFVDRKNYLLRFIYWLQERGFRRLTTFFCFLEGIHYPNRPAAFVIGLKHAKPGSWLEKVYAKEVFKFDNAQNCIVAYQALKRHNIDPGTHQNPEINLVLISVNRSAKPEPEKLAVPPAPPPPTIKRNSRIELFGGTKDCAPK
jgi:hypothetical protein